MKRSFCCLLGTAALLAFVTACAPTPPSPSGETSPPPTLSVVEPTTTPAVVATPTPSPAEPTPTPAPTSPPLDFNAEPPLDEFSASIAVPDFLTEEQQDLYRRAHCLYQNMFGGFTAAIDFNFPAVETVEWKEPVGDRFVLDDWLYQPARGRYQRWADFDATVHGVFTDRFWESKNILSDGLPIYRDFDGRLGLREFERGSGYYYNENFPDEFRLDKQTEEEISFTLIGHYSPVWPKEGETYEERDARLEREYDQTKEFPIRMVLTEDGWRFDEFHAALADEPNTIEETSNVSEKGAAAISRGPAVSLFAFYNDEDIADFAVQGGDDTAENVAVISDDLIFVVAVNDGKTDACGLRQSIAADAVSIQIFIQT